jgi:hypothetical protein
MREALVAEMATARRRLPPRRRPKPPWWRSGVGATGSSRPAQSSTGAGESRRGTTWRAAVAAAEAPTGGWRDPQYPPLAWPQRWCRVSRSETDRGGDGEQSSPAHRPMGSIDREQSCVKGKREASEHRADKRELPVVFTHSFLGYPHPRIICPERQTSGSAPVRRLWSDGTGALLS